MDYLFQEVRALAASTAGGTNIEALLVLILAELRKLNASEPQVKGKKHGR